MKRQHKLIVPRDLVAEYEPNRHNLRTSVSSTGWNPLHRVTCTYQVFNLCNEIEGQQPLGRPAVFHGFCTCGTLIGRNPRHQAFDALAAEDITFLLEPNLHSCFPFRPPHETEGSIWWGT